MGDRIEQYVDRFIAWAVHGLTRKETILLAAVCVVFGWLTGTYAPPPVPFALVSVLSIGMLLCLFSLIRKIRRGDHRG